MARRRKKTNRVNPTLSYPKARSDFPRGVVEVPHGQARNAAAAKLRRDGYAVRERIAEHGEPVA